MNKVILITGTSTGFGRTAAETLGQRGYRVFATMRDCAGRNASACEALRSRADREGWSVNVLDMDGWIIWPERLLWLFSAYTLTLSMS
jgi:NAD(P)-dependent dehydrogenase (short-subunit alcohol dehydrogenase family)